MGKYLILKSGSGGVDTDDVSATAADVIKGKTAGVFGYDEPVIGTLELSGNAGAGEVLTGKTFYTTNPKSKQTGTMPNRGAVSQALNAGGSYAIPAGYHIGSGKVTANSLAGQTSANATAAYISSGKTAWVNGSKITGTLATQGGSTTTPGTANKTIVTASKHVTGNIVVAGNSNLVAANIKKGVNIFGVTGTFEGWVPTTTDLYLNGSNPAGFTISGSTIKMESNSIRYTQSSMDYIQTGKSYNLSPYSYCNIEFLCTGKKYSYVDAVLSATDITFRINSAIDAALNTRKTIAIDIRAVQMTKNLALSMGSASGASGTVMSGYFSGYIYRIWLS